MSGLFVGLNTIDIQFLVNEYPESNTKTIVSRNGVYLGGPATNAAITFSKLGGESTLLKHLGMLQILQPNHANILGPGNGKINQNDTVWLL